MDVKALLIFLAIGLVAGFLAGLIVGGGNFLLYPIWGVIGSFVGGLIFTQFNINLGIKNPIISQIIVSTIGAIVVVLVARLIGG
ncbi:MAG TPA: GlsB/YeaQ/YmgE family stress response membrane protein [Devosia sp.]|nr:GlsB/YeaQ/YmgE family stress response membrane protein [Devosia sp.]